MIVIGFLNGDIVAVCGTKYLILGIHFAYNKKSKTEKNILKAISSVSKPIKNMADKKAILVSISLKIH